MLVAAELSVGEEVFVDFIKFCILPLLFLSFPFHNPILQGYPPLFGVLIIGVSVTCILSYLV